ncbi:MAG: phosphoserine phosphatase SerB, partial [Psychromonas sp.]
MKKIFHPSNSQSLIQWRDILKQDLNQPGNIFYHQREVTQALISDFNVKAELIVMAKQFSTHDLAQLLTLLDNEKVDTIQLFAPEIIENITVMRLALNAYPESLKVKLDDFAKSNQLDFALMQQFPDWSKPGLVLMDMDSTTIQIECIDEIARLYGVGEQVSAVTALAMQGKLDFNQSLNTRVSKLS